MGCWSVQSVQAMHTWNGSTVGRSWGVRFDCPLTSGKLGKYFAKLWDVSTLQLHTLKNADPELGQSVAPSTGQQLLLLLFTKSFTSLIIFFFSFEQFFIISYIFSSFLTKVFISRLVCMSAESINPLLWFVPVHDVLETRYTNACT